VPGHDRVWIPKGQLMPDSAVREDGDQGDLVVTRWIAGEKGIGGAAPGTTRTAKDDLESEG
jgi:hypothetical protein